MEKLLWSEPQITEIKVSMTEYLNKSGNKVDGLSPSTGLCGDITDVGGDPCCS